MDNLVSKRKLTPKQEKFCNMFIETGNQSEAYRLAYNCENMKSESVNNKAYILLNRVDIRSRVAELQKELKTKSDITKEKVLYQLDAILSSDIRDYLCFDGETIMFKDFKELTDKQAKAIEGIKQGRSGIEIKLHGKSWGIERISKMLGYDAPVKTELTGKDGKDLNTLIQVELINLPAQVDENTDSE